jgi:hypothetical protein
MDTRAIRIVAVGVVIALAIGGKVTAGRGSKVSDPTQHELTPQIRAAGLTFAPGVSPGDQQWIREAVASARPEAQTLIGAVDGLVTISTVNVPDAPYVGMAEEGTDRVMFNLAYLDGERKQDRTKAVLHELGHVIDFELIPSDQMQQMAGAVPSTGACMTPESGGCTAPEERFADTFARWALRGAVSAYGAGYQVMSPGSLESWGEPLGLLAAKQSISG